MHMKMVIASCTLSFVGFSGGLIADTCPKQDYTLATDGELDLFEQIGCTRINGTLTVGGGNPVTVTSQGISSATATADVTRLNGLKNLQQVGSLSISYNSALSSLSGISSDLLITEVLEISNNDSLTSLDGLGRIDASNPDVYSIFGNPSLSNCKALAPALGSDSSSGTSSSSSDNDTPSSSDSGYTPDDADDSDDCSCDPTTDWICPDSASGNECSDSDSSTASIVRNNAPGCNSVEEIIQAVNASRTLQVILESPAKSDTYSGIGTLRGWAVAYEGISKVDIYVDGNFLQSAPYGGKREDVGSVFPEINNSDESGFALAFNFSNLSEGNHTIRVRAVTTEDRVLSRSSQFQVTKFPASFLPADQSPDLSEASCVINDQTVHILDALVDGSVYDVSLQWRTADQGFQIREIR